MKMMTLSISLAAMAAAAIGGANAYAAQGPMHPKADANRDGILTRAEAQTAASALFARLDFDKNGILDRNDRTLHREQMKTHLFDRLDANKDGQITRAEFMAGKGPGGDRGPGRHRLADNGPAGADGLRGPGRPGHEGPRGHGGRHARMMAMARMADTNGDKAISQAEFTAAALQRFDGVDANKDGKVTPEERRAAHEAMRAKWQQMRAQKAQG